MKNKLCYILIGILVSFSFMNTVFAEDAFEYNIDVTTDSTDVVVGSEVDVKISLKSEANISDCLFQIDTDDNIEFVTTDDVNGWSVDKKYGVGENGIHVESSDFATSGTLSNGLNIVSIKYKINGNGSLKVTTSSYCSDGENDVNSEERSITFTTKELSQDTTLSSIKVNGKELDNFSPNNYEGYAVQIDSPNFSIEYTATNTDYQDDVVVTMLDGTKIDNLSNITFTDSSGQGVMPINISVNGGTPYNFAVRYTAKNLDNSLASLKINGEVIGLQSGITNYTHKIGKDVTSVKVEAVLKDSENFKFAIHESGVWEHDTKDSNTTISIEIEPTSDQNGGTGEMYTIQVIKEGDAGGAASSSKPSSSSKIQTGTSDVEKNPQTGNISMFVMALILISSLVGSIFLYQKNIESYK